MDTQTEIKQIELIPTDEQWTQALEERDRYHHTADELAAAIAKHLGADLGEHSSDNCPWANALEWMEAAASVPPAPQGEREDALRELQEGWDLLHTMGAHPANMRRLSAAMKVVEAAFAAPAVPPVEAQRRAEQARMQSYDAIDRYLRNNLDDTDYAEYSEHLETVFRAAPGEAQGERAEFEKWVMECVYPGTGNEALARAVHGYRHFYVNEQWNAWQRRAALAVAPQVAPQGEPVGYLPAYEMQRLEAGHDARLRSAKFGSSALDGDIAVYAEPSRPAAAPGGAGQNP